MRKAKRLILTKLFEFICLQLLSKITQGQKKFYYEPRSKADS